MAASAILGLVGCGPASDQALIEELRERADSGLALVRLRGNLFSLQKFNGPAPLLPNPRGFSNAWFSSDGKTVLWALDPGQRKQDPACPYPAVVEALAETQQVQLPGLLANVHAMGVSSDGKQLAFDALFQPGSVGESTHNRAKGVTGLQYLDLRTATTKLILPLSDGSERITSISFAPGGAQFAYDYKGRIFVYDVGSGSSRMVAEGTGPTWSPDGRWIAIRAGNGEASVLSASTFRPESVLTRRQSDSTVRWSPDSRYVMVVEPVGLGWTIFHMGSGVLAQMIVERIQDHATAVVDKFVVDGIDGRGFYWISDSAAFLRQAASSPMIQGCGGGL